MLTVYLVIAVAAFAAGLSKGGLGGTLAAIVTPLLVLVMPAPLAVGLSLPLLYLGDMFAILAHWRKWEWSIVAQMLPATVLGVIFATAVSGSISPTFLQHLVGFIAIVYSIYRLWQMRIGKLTTLKRGIVGASIFGGLTGFASTLLNAGGPIVAMYLLMLEVAPTVFISSTAVFFFFLDSMKAVSYFSTGLLTPSALLIVVGLLPVVPFGVWSGVIFAKRVNRTTFETVILGLLTLTGVILMLK